MTSIQVPTEIADTEKVIRVLLDPIHIRNSREIKPYAFQPPKESQDISVNRESYISFGKCKNQGILMQNEKNTFWGLGIILVSDIKQNGFDVVASPITTIPSNYAHADIKIGELKQENIPLSIETTLRIKNMISKINVILDPSPDKETWEI